ncbi:putative bordetella pertussis Bvg accessory factor [Crocosphaera subtropica ATCC 51142]|uniref:Type III pantothenate kinase n=1 Tax=Crocosphaera subtropica (strain ATCC 51142 / BH68) TaxID=43989 RepID=B1WXN0_CROS5|nr:pantothenate kinase [Crocosphaera subtropica]ACB52571.1 putative bordetella pertussis Bvg accessory factor [Crocosphaera subtropica ATCC 51142]
MNRETSKEWLALMIGNSRLHWGYFQGEILQNTWNTTHHDQLIDPLILPNHCLLGNLSLTLPLIVASVVPSQTKLWQNYQNTVLINLEDIPLNNLYQTIGIDRALAALGAGDKYHFPCLVIDAGTALTLTGIDSDRTFIGGAILPGLKLQFNSLSTKTAALPNIDLPKKLGDRWAGNTENAMISGILYTLISGIKTFINDWLYKYPDSEIVLTGGDAAQLYDYFQQDNYEHLEELTVDHNLIFWGIRSINRLDI